MVDPPHGLPAEVVTAYRIEPGAASHVATLRDLERTAGARFRTIGMARIAEGDPTPAEILLDRAESRRLYVSLDGRDEPAGFLIWSSKDGFAYIEEVSVHPDHAGHRLAARMIDRLEADVRGRLPALTLATFRDVPWNAPYYAKLGFGELPLAAVGPDHRASWQRQADAGLDMSKRLFMIRPVAP